MLSHLRVSRTAGTHLVLVAVAGLALAANPVLAESGLDVDDSFTWSAELVAFDEMANMVTVKSLVVGRELIDWSAFNEGDQVLLTWSGITSATGVRYLSHDEPDLENARLTMPVEFVSFENDGRYVTFRVAIPESDVDHIKSLTAGEWVTATTPYSVGEDLVVVAIRPYNAIG